MNFGQNPPRPGEPAPLFVLNCTTGGRVALHERRDRQPVMLMFFRGFW
jgi:peroxiredoxin